MAKSNKSEIGTVGFASPKIFRDYAPDILVRLHSRFFDCLAHPNLSVTFAADQK